MNGALKVLGILLIVIVVAAGGLYVWASSASARALDGTVETHTVDFPIPFPLTPEERAELGVTDDGAAEEVALERAVERGEHLVNARYGCTECHGADFGGGVMVDAFPLGSIFGPNLTRGEGGVDADLTPADWDRIVRHGVGRDGTASLMPSQDFQHMSDRELSDIVAYIRSLPPVDNEVAPPALGPLGRVLLATGALPLSSELIASHTAGHVVEPPDAAPTVEFGAHLAAPCMGCHGPELVGGPVPGGDPGWPPARNLTPHEEALGSWSFEEFRTAMLEARRPDGTELREPMAAVASFARNMTDVEMEALWLYLRSIPPVPPSE